MDNNVNPEELAEEAQLDEIAPEQSAQQLMVPPQVEEIISILKQHTYQAYLVGDCVRALLKGENPLDFDIITDAEMKRLLAIFEDRFKTNTDYVNKGELIIINGAMGISVSPYRCRIAEDGRPIYCADAIEDLKRRAFKSSAVAYSLTDGIYDPFDGLEELMGETVTLSAIITEQDIAPEPPKSILKGKKEPEAPTPLTVFKNNPDAVLEAMRRYSTEGVEISRETLKNICENPDVIFKIPSLELQKSIRTILLGKRVADTLMMFKEVVFAIIPKLRETDGFDQHSLVQEYPLYEHLARSVGYAVPDFPVRLALLFHGIGKTDCAADMGSYYSYSGHAVRGAMLAREILTQLNFPAELIRQVTFLVLHHDDDVDESNYTSYTAEYGTEVVRQMVLMKAADVRAKRSDYDYEQRAGELRFIADEIGRIGTEYTRKNSVTLSDLRKLTKSLGL